MTQAEITEIKAKIEELECEISDNEDLANDYNMEYEIRRLSKEVADRDREDIARLRALLDKEKE